MIETSASIIAVHTASIFATAAHYAIDQRRTAVKLMLVPLPEHNSKWDVIREPIVESREWAGLILPSVKALGIAARELDGQGGKIGFQNEKTITFDRNRYASGGRIPKTVEGQPVRVVNVDVEKLDDHIKRKDLTTMFKQSTTGVVGDISTGSIYLVMVSNSATAAWQLAGEVRYRYSDL